MTNATKNIIDICIEEEGYRLFDVLEEYAELPDWIPYLLRS